MKIDYAIIIKNQTRLEALIQRFNTKAQAQFYIEKQGGNFADYVQEHDTFHRALHQVQTQLSKVLKHKIVERAYLPNYLFADNNLLVVVGQDGLVANTAKYARGLPIIAVNPDPARYDGLLLPFDPHNFIYAVEEVVNDNYPARQLHFAEATLHDGQRLLAFNDLFIGAATHVSARYKISFAKNSEEHSSSGIIISTSAGASGWLSSIFNMAYGLIGKSGKSSQASRPRLKAEQLLFVVREPFASIRTQTGICSGLIEGREKLTIESFMPTNGVIFSDGIEQDFLHFNSGTVAQIGLAQERATMVLQSQKALRLN